MSSLRPYRPHPSNGLRLPPDRRHHRRQWIRHSFLYACCSFLQKTDEITYEMFTGSYSTVNAFLADGWFPADPMTMSRDEEWQSQSSLFELKVGRYVLVLLLVFVVYVFSSALAFPCHWGSPHPRNLPRASRNMSDRKECVDLNDGNVQGIEGVRYSLSAESIRVRLALSSVLNFRLISSRSRLGKTLAIRVKSVPHILSAW